VKFPTPDFLLSAGYTKLESGTDQMRGELNADIPSSSTGVWNPDKPAQGRTLYILRCRDLLSRLKDPKTAREVAAHIGGFIFPVTDLRLLT